MNLMAFVLGVCWILAAYPVAFAKEKAADLWVEQKGVELLAERQADGDSFGMKVQSEKGKRVKRTYRLYEGAGEDRAGGADC